MTVDEIVTTKKITAKGKEDKIMKNTAIAMGKSNKYREYYDRYPWIGRSWAGCDLVLLQKNPKCHLSSPISNSSFLDDDTYTNVQKLHSALLPLLVL